MNTKTLTTLSIFFIISQFSFCLNDKKFQIIETHDAICKTFFFHFIKKEHKSCWKYIDKEYKKETSYKTYLETGNQLLTYIPEESNYIELYETTYSYDSNGNEKNKYTYKIIRNNGIKTNTCFTFVFKKNKTSKITSLLIKKC